MRFQLIKKITHNEILNKDINQIKILAKSF
jgi:hypothetical protein